MSVIKLNVEVAFTLYLNKIYHFNAISQDKIYNNKNDRLLLEKWLAESYQQILF